MKIHRDRPPEPPEKKKPSETHKKAKPTRNFDKTLRQKGPPPSQPKPSPFTTRPPQSKRDAEQKKSDRKDKKEKTKESKEEIGETKESKAPIQRETGMHEVKAETSVTGKSPIDRVIQVFQENPIYTSQLQQVKIGGTEAQPLISVTLANGIEVNIQITAGKELNLEIKGLTQRTQALLDNPVHQAYLRDKLMQQGFVIHQIQTVRAEAPIETRAEESIFKGEPEEKEGEGGKEEEKEGKGR